MKPSSFFQAIILTILVMFGCQKENVLTVASGDENAIELRRGKPTRCTNVTYCIKFTGDITGCQSAVNCEEASQIIVSKSSGPNNDQNTAMVLDISHVTTPAGCEKTGDGPLVINSDGSIEYYYRSGNNKYGLRAIGVLSGDWKDDFAIQFGNGGEIVKDGRHDKDCLGHRDFVATLMVKKVANRDACDEGTATMCNS